MSLLPPCLVPASDVCSVSPADDHHGFGCKKAKTLGALCCARAQLQIWGCTLTAAAGVILLTKSFVYI